MCREVKEIRREERDHQGTSAVLSLKHGTEKRREDSQEFHGRTGAKSPWAGVASVFILPSNLRLERSLPFLICKLPSPTDPRGAIQRTSESSTTVGMQT